MRVIFRPLLDPAVARFLAAETGEPRRRGVFTTTQRSSQLTRLLPRAADDASRSSEAQRHAPEFPLLCLTWLWVSDYLPLGVGYTSRLQGIDRALLSLLQQGTFGLRQGEIPESREKWFWAPCLRLRQSSSRSWASTRSRRGAMREVTQWIALPNARRSRFIG